MNTKTNFAERPESRGTSNTRLERTAERARPLSRGPGEATRGKFESFVEQHFPQLSEALKSCRPGRRGSATLYDGFRNGFAHLRAPKPEFAIVEDHEVDGLWADRIDIVGVGEFVAINVDRLAREFLSLLDTLEAA